ncbi:MAG TPA: hypothetical protein VMP08_00700 [Anaerolineae bacterium]|nr:hypothetical protein [Anaerolineae bacterium]
MNRSVIDYLIRVKGKWLAGCALLVLLGLLVVRLDVGLLPTAAAQPAVPEIFASPVHAGCYLARADRCKIHVEPFTINIASGQKLALFRLVAIRSSTGVQTIIYDWRPDQSNPAPASGTTYTPSRVAKDFAATCGEAYEISLQGRDTGDTHVFNLGLTDQLTCPKGTFSNYLPLTRKN